MIYCKQCKRWRQQKNYFGRIEHSGHKPGRNRICSKCGAHCPPVRGIGAAKLLKGE